MKETDAAWVAAGQRATFYRVTNDFHANEPNALAEHAFVAGNLSSKFSGLNNTYLDLDIMDLGVDSPYHGTPAARLHAAVWMMSRSALMFAGEKTKRPLFVSFLFALSCLMMKKDDLPRQARDKCKQISNKGVF
jgi:hypothetical protein